jgi:hypothetical protein
MDLLFCFRKYPTLIIVVCLAAALAAGAGSCGRTDTDRSDSRELSKDEIYLIDAYVEIKLARGYYPSDPAVADSLFAVLDSTIDSARIANTIQSLNQEPERWALIFEEIERRLREAAQNPAGSSAGKPQATRKESK